MAELEQVEKLLATASLAGPADDEAIRSAEDELEITFPPSYRLFLSKFGAALCNGFEFAGLFDIRSPDNNPPLWSSVVTTIHQVRRSSGGRIPDNYVYVSDDGGDYTFYVNTARTDARGECPVIVLEPGTDAGIVAKDFFDFVVRFFEGSLSY